MLYATVMLESPGPSIRQHILSLFFFIPARMLDEYPLECLYEGYSENELKKYVQTSVCIYKNSGTIQGGYCLV